MVAKIMKTVSCMDCGSQVPCMSTRMRRCQECMYAHTKELYKQHLEVCEREIARL
jgi:hypothetical protein